MNLMGALRRTIATAGYSDPKEFQRVEVVVAPGRAPRRPRPAELDNQREGQSPIPRVR